MLGRCGKESLHLWDRPEAAVHARIGRAGDSGGTIGLDSSESAAQSPDEAQIGVRMMEDERAWPNPLTLEPRRRSRRFARTHARARGGEDRGDMSGACGDGTSQRAWRAERQHGHGQGKAAGCVERKGAKRRMLDADRPGVVAMRQEGREAAADTSVGSGGSASGDSAFAPRRDARHGGAVMGSLP